LSGDPALFNRVWHTVGMDPEDLHPSVQMIAKAIADIMRQPDGIPSVPNVWTCLNNVYSIDGLNALYFNWGVDEKQATSSARYVKRQAMVQRRVKVLTNGIEMLQKKGDQNEIIGQIMRELSTAGKTEIASPIAGDIINRMWNRKDDDEKQHTTPTNIDWFDFLLKGGVKSRRFIAIAGNEKNRKSTLARNLLMGLLRDENGNVNKNVGIAFFALENDQDTTILDLLVMLMYEYLLMKKITSKNFNGKNLAEWCDSELIAPIYILGPNEWPKMLSADLVAAMNYGTNILQQVNLRVYDALEKNGGLRTFKDLERIANRDYFVYGSPDIHTIWIVDYAQLAVIEKATVYEIMREFSAWGIYQIRGKNLSLISLSQNNVQSKMKFKGKGAIQQTADVLGTTGGGDLGNAVHNYFEVQYQENAKPHPRLLVKHRRGRRAKKSMIGFDLHPESGCIIGTEEVDEEDFN
jgi:hypothetical protein